MALARWFGGSDRPQTLSGFEGSSYLLYALTGSQDLINPHTRGNEMVLTLEPFAACLVVQYPATLC